ncbi:hypothetical protein NBRC110019_25500 [Neptunitalea chrysea]|uniref:Uncharacterized protein n=1 Tax=Neptunitalea chrysea TaxID=1647581 RepID=A0A9W6EV83_9FLAO|nr:DUF6686 family protein [Neptunitalea chrysea]GLB53509.1 hypothetical protein NBRC110019_25500 [Neptunitalea chrysea]
MNKNIHILHRNDLGIAFMWEKPQHIITEKIQVIFRDLGFYLTYDELNHFKKCVDDAFSTINDYSFDCMNDCRSMLLHTPVEQLDIAVSYEELTDIADLIEGALFKVDLEVYLKKICKN